MMRARCDNCGRPTARLFEGGELVADGRRAVGAYLMCLCEACADEFRRALWALHARFAPMVPRKGGK